jgi:hypothetical protein
LIIATPAFEIHSVVSKTGLHGGQKGKRRVAWLLELCGLATWLGGFWYLGRGLLGSYLHEESYLHEHTFTEGCLERIGIIGISLMASLAGFAAISSLWQTFGVKYRPVCHMRHYRLFIYMLTFAGNGIGHCPKASRHPSLQRHAPHQREPAPGCRTQTRRQSTSRLHEPRCRHSSWQPRYAGANHTTAGDPRSGNHAAYSAKLNVSSPE